MNIVMRRQDQSHEKLKLKLGSNEQTPVACFADNLGEMFFLFTRKMYCIYIYILRVL